MHVLYTTRMVIVHLDLTPASRIPHIMYNTTTPPHHLLITSKFSPYYRVHPRWTPTQGRGKPTVKPRPMRQRSPGDIKTPQMIPNHPSWHHKNPTTNRMKSTVKGLEPAPPRPHSPSP